MIRRYEAERGGRWRGYHILTVKMCNLIMIDITLFIIGITLLMTDIIFLRFASSEYERHRH